MSALSVLRPLLGGVLSVFVFGCDRGPSYEDAVVDCSTLVPVPMERYADLESETLLDGLGRGQARVALLWTTKEGTRAYLSHAAPGEALANLFGGWAVQAKLDCIPDSTTSIHLEGPADGPRPLESGVYPVSGFGFDVPYLEQGSDSGNTEVEGEVVVRSLADGRVTGYVGGRASASLKSHFGQRALGISVELGAMAFNEVRLLGDYPPVE